MPALKNPRHEAMANGLAEGKTQQKAHREAGFTGNSAASAAAVATRPDVKARVNEIIATQHKREIRSNEKAIEDAAISKGWIVHNTKYVVMRSIRGTKPIFGPDGEPKGWLPTSGDNRAAIDGMKLLSGLGGFLIERHEVGGPGDFSRMTEEELMGELIEVGRSIGLTDQALQKVIGNE